MVQLFCIFFELSKYHKKISWNALTSSSSLVAIVIKGLMILGSKCHQNQNNSPVVCDGYVKYEEADIDRFVEHLENK